MRQDNLVFKVWHQKGIYLSIILLPVRSWPPSFLGGISTPGSTVAAFKVVGKLIYQFILTSMNSCSDDPNSYLATLILAILLEMLKSMRIGIYVITIHVLLFAIMKYLRKYQKYSCTKVL